MIFINTLRLYPYINRTKWKAIVITLIILTALRNVTSNGIAFGHIQHHTFQGDFTSPSNQKIQNLCYIVGIYYCIGVLYSK